MANGAEPTEVPAVRYDAARGRQKRAVRPAPPSFFGKKNWSDTWIEMPADVLNMMKEDQQPQASSPPCTHAPACPPSTHALTHARTHARTHAPTHPHTHARTHAPAPQRTHARTHAHTHARTHTPTHAHTRARTRLSEVYCQLFLAFQK